VWESELGYQRFLEGVVASVIGNLVWYLMLAVVVGVGGLALMARAQVEPSNSPVTSSVTSQSAIASRTSTLADLGPSISEPPTAATTPTAADFCPPRYGYGFDVSNGTFKPGMTISGPTALQSWRGSYELGEALGIPDVPRWGIDVPVGRSVTIPSSITLLGGQGNWAPTGFYEVYASDADMASAQAQWLTYCP
jgi:hypothetical protein